MEQIRKQVQEAFLAEQETWQKQAVEQQKKDMEEQQRKLKEMKMTVWDFFTQGPPPPPNGDSEQNATPSEIPSQA